MLVHFFSGSALCAVDAAGRLVLPAFVRATLARRGHDLALLIGAHERAPCLAGYDRSVLPMLHAEAERRRLASPDGDRAHHAYARRAFGLAEEVAVDAGQAVLPPLMRRRAGIGALALLVGSGASFEIWDVEAARDSDDPDLADLARFHLETRHAA